MNLRADFNSSMPLKYDCSIAYNVDSSSGYVFYDKIFENVYGSSCFQIERNGFITLSFSLVGPDCPGPLYQPQFYLYKENILIDTGYQFTFTEIGNYKIMNGLADSYNFSIRTVPANPVEFHPITVMVNYSMVDVTFNTVGTSEEINFAIFNISGNQLFSSKSQISTDNRKIEIDVGDLPAGIYVLHCWNENNNATSTFFIDP